jgi:hypothetical protein
MNIFLKIATVCIALSGLTAVKGFALDVRYDGLYRYHEPAKQVSIYLRFYPDGTVLSTASTGKPDEVAKWLHRGSKIDSGNFAVEKEEIRFAISTAQGSNDCGGVLKETLILLKCADTDASLLFEFLPMRLPK